MKVEIENEEIVVVLSPDDAYKIGLTLAGAAPHAATPDVEAVGLHLMDAANTAGVDHDKMYDTDIVIETPRVIP